MEIVLILLRNHWKSGTYLSCNGLKARYILNRSTVCVSFAKILPGVVLYKTKANFTF